MSKKDFDTTVRRQTMSLVEMVDGQVDHHFDQALLKALIPDGTDFTDRNVIMTGAGDSWAAAGAMRPMMQRYLDLDRCFAPDPMEFCRVMTADDMGCNEKNKPLVVAITVGGGTARVTEVLPVMTGSRIEAVKQKRDFCRIKPKMPPVIQKKPRFWFREACRMPITTITSTTRMP